MTGPSAPTIKRLFNQSGELCNYAGCTQPIVVESGTIVVDICHIAAASEGGPRYDASQTDAQMHGFDNLILLCPNHHRVVDGSPDNYPVEALMRMKVDASSTGNGVSLSDKAADGLVAALVAAAGSAVVSVGQVGGQTAQTIVNIGSPARHLSDEVTARMRTHLRPHVGSCIAFASCAGDPEAAGYKRQLMEAFHSAGWEVVDQATFMFFGSKTGIVLTIPHNAQETAAPIQAAAAALDETGQLLGGNRGDMANEAGMYVEVWPTATVV